MLQSNPELSVYNFQRLRQYHHINTHWMQLFKRYFALKKKKQSHHQQNSQAILSKHYLATPVPPAVGVPGLQWLTPPVPSAAPCQESQPPQVCQSACLRDCLLICFSPKEHGWKKNPT